MHGSAIQAVNNSTFYKVNLSNAEATPGTKLGRKMRSLHQKNMGNSKRPQAALFKSRESLKARYLYGGADMPSAGFFNTASGSSLGKLQRSAAKPNGRSSRPGRGSQLPDDVSNLTPFGGPHASTFKSLPLNAKVARHDASKTPLLPSQKPLSSTKLPQ